MLNLLVAKNDEKNMRITQELIMEIVLVEKISTAKDIVEVQNTMIITTF